MNRILSSLLSALCLLIPASAFAAEGYTVATVNMLAGPNPEYPLILTLGAGTPVDVQGCTEGWEWCDVVAAGNRGWVAGPYIEYMYENQPVIVTNYGPRIGIPIVTFAIGAYWGRYYVNRPFYRDRTRWYGRPMPIRPPPGPRPPVRPFPPVGHRPSPPRPGHGAPPRGHSGYHPAPPRPGTGGHHPHPPQQGGGHRPPSPTAGRPMPPAGNRPRPTPGGHPPPPGSNGHPQNGKPPAHRPPPKQNHDKKDNGG